MHTEWLTFSTEEDRASERAIHSAWNQRNWLKTFIGACSLFSELQWIFAPAKKTRTHKITKFYALLPNFLLENILIQNSRFVDFTQNYRKLYWTATKYPDLCYMRNMNMYQKWPWEYVNVSVTRTIATLSHWVINNSDGYWKNDS